MKKWIFYLLCFTLLASCKEDLIQLDGSREVTAEEFVKFFPAKKLPFRWDDSLLAKPVSDSFLINAAILQQFIPDSVFKEFFPKKAKPRYYAVGKAKEKDKDYYLFIKAVSGAKKVGLMAVFSSEYQFNAAIPLVKMGYETNKYSYGMLDNKFQISIYREKGSVKEIQYKRNVYIYNSMAGLFTLIMTEPNEEIIEDVINPIDSFPAKVKWSGNYVKDKRNFISIRDGKTLKEFQFFVHFEKNNGSCNGEIKGIARVISKNKAEYFEHGNTCRLEFKFEGSQVSISETGGCGAFRDIKCLFEGSYPFKKAARKNNAR